MSATILLARDRQVTAIPQATWEQHLVQVPHHTATRLRFMSADHHRVRTFAVTEIGRTGRVVPPEAICQALRLPGDRVQAILDELERELFFLVRNEQGAVAWAYPVTASPTPHALSFDSGERLYAA